MSPKCLFLAAALLPGCVLLQDFTVTSWQGLVLKTQDVSQGALLAKDLDHLASWEQLYTWPGVYQRLGVTDGSSPLVRFLKKNIEAIHASPDNCTPFTLACVYPGDTTLYVNDRFFLQDRDLRLSTLLHEAMHLHTGQDHGAGISVFRLERDFLEQVFTANLPPLPAGSLEYQKRVLALLERKIAQEEGEKAPQ